LAIVAVMKAGDRIWSAKCG